MSRDSRGKQFPSNLFLCSNKYAPPPPPHPLHFSFSPPGNNRFVHISELNADQIAESLTVFNLVKPEYIPRLFDLFALALRGGSPPPLVLQQSPLAPGNMLDPQYASSSRSDDNAPSRDEASSEEDQRSSNDESLSGGESKSTVVSSSEKEEVEKNEDEAEEGNEKEYLLASMTVPCAHFPSGHATFVMTVSDKMCYFVCCRNTSFR